jgi:hypothetical protein
MQKLIYLASPYSSDYADIIERRVSLVQDATAKLIEQGHLIFSPVVHSHPLADQVSFSHINTDTRTSGWMSHDLAMLDCCDELWILMIDGWEKSRGIAAEYGHAINTHKKIRYIDYPSLKERDFLSFRRGVDGTFRDAAKRSGTWDTPSTGQPKENINDFRRDDTKWKEFAAKKRSALTVGDEHPTLPEYVLGKIYESGSLLYTRRALDHSISKQKERRYTSEEAENILDKIFGDKPKKLIVGLNGVAQSGKDTVGAYLVKYHGFTRVAFADPIRDALLALNPTIKLSNYNTAKLDEVLDHYTNGWDDAKTTYAEVRELLQRIGTEAGRGIHGDDCWTKITERRIAEIDGPVVVTDCRFENEARLVHELGGEVWGITRQSVGSVNGHISDRPLHQDFIDSYIGNNTTLDKLYGEVENALAYYVKK